MYTRFRKVVILVVLLVLCMIVSSTAVFASAGAASASDGKLTSEIEKTNLFIEKAIDDACSKADQMVANIMNSNHPQKEEKIDAVIDQIISQLIKQTDHKVSILVKKGNKEGVEIVTEFVEVTIYDRTILVDPCYAH